MERKIDSIKNQKEILINMLFTVESIKANPELLKTLEEVETCPFCNRENSDIGPDKFAIDNTVCCSDCFYEKFSEILEQPFNKNKT